MVVNVVGQTLFIQGKGSGHRSVDVSVETYTSPRSMMNRVEELHLRGQISHKRYQHLAEIISRKAELNLRKS